MTTNVTSLSNDTVTSSAGIVTTPPSVSNANTTTPFIIIGTPPSTDCPSLTESGLVLSTTNSSIGTEVGVSCDEFGHRPSDDVTSLLCQANSTWTAEPQCEWSWDFKTQDKIIFGTAVAAVSFLVIVIIAVFIAYYCCYKKRKESDERLYGSSVQGSSAQLGVDGPYAESVVAGAPPYVAYQNGTEKHDGYAPNGGMPDKMWLGYIPRPKVVSAAEGRRLYH